jgi:uncharacterized protein
MKRIFGMLEKLSDNPNVGLMDSYIQHGDTSCLMHTIAVAYYSMRLAEKLHIKVHEKELLRGALLHDYFLYDWHDGKKERRVHGFTHPGTAMKNAARDFDINAVERDIIRKHMFPLTPKPPTTRESWIVCMVDKGCSLYETFKRDNYRGIRKVWIKDFKGLYKELRGEKNGS